MKCMQCLMGSIYYKNIWNETPILQKWLDIGNIGKKCWHIFCQYRYNVDKMQTFHCLDNISCHTRIRLYGYLQRYGKYVQYWHNIALLLGLYHNYYPQSLTRFLLTINIFIWLCIILNNFGWSVVGWNKIVFFARCI